MTDTTTATARRHPTTPAPQCCTFHNAPVFAGLDPELCAAYGGYCCDACPTLAADGGDR